MTNHNPGKCKICGTYHCLAGCVPVEVCQNRVKMYKVLKAIINSETILSRDNFNNALEALSKEVSQPEKDE